MGQRKSADWLQPEKLKLLLQWKKAGSSDREIAKEMGISAVTLKQWEKRYPTIAAALQEKEGPDNKVEDALLRRALGFTAVETTYECVRDEDGNEKMVVKRKVEKQVPPDLSAQTFWLKNRHPDKWKAKPEAEEEKQDITVRLTDD